MNKKVLIPVVIVGILLVAGIAFLAIRLDKQKQENREMQELAELDKKKWRTSISSLQTNTAR